MNTSVHENQNSAKIYTSRSVFARILSAIEGVAGALGVLLLSASVNAAVPDGSVSTGGYTSIGPGFQILSQSGGYGSIYSEANLNTLTATSRIDTGPYAFTAHADVYYYFEVLSGSGTFNVNSIPLLITGTGYTDVGNSALVSGFSSGFNHNQATADIRVGGHSIASACAGYQCYSGAQTSFSGAVFNLSLLTAGPNIFQISLDTSVSTNSNYQSSYAHAFVDPYIQIDPTFLAAHPDYSLSFSAGVVNAPAVPVPAAAWLMGSGLLSLAGIARRKK